MNTILKDELIQIIARKMADTPFSDLLAMADDLGEGRPLVPSGTLVEGVYILDDHLTPVQTQLIELFQLLGDDKLEAHAEFTNADIILPGYDDVWWACVGLRLVVDDSAHPDAHGTHVEAVLSSDDIDPELGAAQRVAINSLPEPIQRDILAGLMDGFGNGGVLGFPRQPK